MTCKIYTIKGIALYFLCDLNLNNYNRIDYFHQGFLKSLKTHFWGIICLRHAPKKPTHQPTKLWKMLINVYLDMSFLIYILINWSDSENQLGQFIIVEMDSKCNSALSIFNKKRKGQVVLGSQYLQLSSLDNGMLTKGAQWSGRLTYYFLLPMRNQVYLGIWSWLLSFFF